ncbi:DUF3892 domain-containing protein [Bacillus sp. T33-2]|uniref:DUF3892 domain-containing protein n=1 Tax=Bacillus sp. T33-2 TaxID=2054168 RepID=UPI000C767CF9|nr:DUF3892 domain-containing protein [Bacillus sp. T33-2]PLR99667.1 hypothetical protein CVD19_00990 [Bacillus sp. T33-2]
MQGEKLIAVQKNHFGDIISFQTSGGRIISYRKALAEAANGEIEGINILESDDGMLSLAPQNNQSFDHLPSIY